MSERRTENRPNSSDRRDIPRPPLWFNLLLLAVAVGVLIFARQQRLAIDAEYSRVFSGSSAGPSELNQMAAELAELGLAKAALEKELESRLARVESLKHQDFYLSLNTAEKTLSLKSGNETLLAASVQKGEIPKGVFTVAGKRAGPPAVIALSNDRAVTIAGPATDLEALLRQISKETRVYVF